VFFLGDRFCFFSKNDSNKLFLFSFIVQNENSDIFYDDYFISVLFYMFPELYLFLIIVFSLIFNLSLKNYYNSFEFVNFSIYYILILLTFLFIILLSQFGISVSFFNNNFYIDPFITFSKLFILFCLIFVFLLSLDYFKFERFQITEYSVIVLLSLLGMFILVSANDFIVLYLSLELQSFCLYILASIKRYSNLSIEAALKYFILGSFSSGIFLFGISLLYGFFGTTNFFEINVLIYSSDIFINYSFLVIISLLFISIGVLFKLAIFPFHF